MYVLVRGCLSQSQILTTLVGAFPDKHITCKIRLLERFEDTVDLVRMIRGTGVSAIGVHGR